MDNSPYFDQPLFPFAVALPRMLAGIESELPTALPKENRCLETRAELMRSLLAPSGVPGSGSIDLST